MQWAIIEAKRTFAEGRIGEIANVRFLSTPSYVANRALNSTAIDLQPFFV
jgi:hypothetical protein